MLRTDGNCTLANSNCTKMNHTKELDENHHKLPSHTQASGDEAICRVQHILITLGGVIFQRLEILYYSPSPGRQILKWLKFELRG